MGLPLIAFSQNEADLKLVKIAALANAVQYHEMTDLAAVRRFIERNPRAILFWDYDAYRANKEVIEFMTSSIRPKLNIIVGNGHLSDHPNLIREPYFGTYIQRRDSEVASLMYRHFVGAILQENSLGLASYFEPGTKINRITISKSGHKKNAIEALQKTLTNRGIKGRLATIAAQSVDELILNAIFDAPIMPPNSTRYRHGEPRDKDFDLFPNEVVSVEMAASASYVGICVSDPFGSMSRGTAFSALRSYFANEASNDTFLGPSSGFGLNGIVQSGLSLRVNCQSGKQTDAVVFFPIIESFREFRTSFRFFSFVSDR